MIPEAKKYKCLFMEYFFIKNDEKLMKQQLRMEREEERFNVLSMDTGENSFNH